MFYLSWGTKVFEKKEGIAADFCPICRHPTGVEVRQIRSQNHVYHIGLGEGTVVGRLCRCLDCQSAWPLRAGTIEMVVNPASPVSLETLLSETYPRLSLVDAKRLEQEAAILRNPHSLDGQSRLQLIAEPFFVLDHEVEKEDQRTTFWGFLGGLGCLGSIGFAIATIAAFSTQGPLWGIAWLLVSVGLAWLSLKLSVAGDRRYMRAHIYPRLASCLAPLDPSLEELAAVVAGIKSKCVNKTRLQDLMPLVDEARAHRQPVGGR